MADAQNDQICCPRFNPEPWQDKQISWDEKLFVRDRLKCLFHIPLNFGKLMKKNMALIEAAGARGDDIVLCDEDSLWGADLYIGVAEKVPSAQMATISGTFMSRVFEGPYKEVKNWYKKMAEFVAGKDTQAKKIYAYYTTCPKCAKKYGKNYVVLLAQI